MGRNSVRTHFPRAKSAVFPQHRISNGQEAHAARPVVILEKTAEALPTLDRCRPAPRQFLGTRGAEEYVVLVKK